MSIALGIDLGGTKAEIIGLDREGREKLRHRVPHVGGSYQTTLDTLVDLVNYAENELAQTCTLGICHPGAVSPKTGLLQGSNATWLNGMPFGADLIARLTRPIAFANDANCLALSEATDGAGAGADVVFALIIGTGCGGGIAINRQVVNGAHAMAGEVCHIPLPWPRADELPGPQCYCGKSGCLDAWLAGPALEADHLRVTGQQKKSIQIAQAAQTSDTEAIATLARFEDRLARALAMLIQLIDPNVIVVGGGLSNIDQIYVNVTKQMQAYVSYENVTTTLARAHHGDSSGVRGAAWLGRDLAALRDR